MSKVIESEFVHECKKCDTVLEVHKLKLSWTLKSIQNFTQYYAGGSANKLCSTSNKYPSWYLRLIFSSRVPDYYCIYLSLRDGEEIPININIKISLLNDKNEVKVLTKPPIVRSSHHVDTQTFVHKDFLYNLATNSIVKIVGEITYMINNFEFPNEKSDLTKIDFKNEWCQNFKQLLEMKRYSDLTITVGEKKFTAHKAILAARSRVFAAMFEHKMMESHTSNIIITDIDCDVFEEVLNYIYTTKTPRLEEMPLELLAAADKYFLSGLKSLCEQELIAILSLETSLDILIFADLHNAVTVKADAIKFINSKAVEIMKTERWELIEKSHPHLIIEAYEEFVIEANKCIHVLHVLPSTVVQN